MYEHDDILRAIRLIFDAENAEKIEAAKRKWGFRRDPDVIEFHKRAKKRTSHGDLAVKSTVSRQQTA